MTVDCARQGRHNRSRSALCGDVQDNFEFEQRRTRSDGLRALAGMGFTGGAVTPIGERLLGLPLGHHEVAALTGGGAEELESEKARGVLDCVSACCETLLQFGAGALGDLDCIDLHDCHASDITRAPSPRTVTLVLHDEGGTGQPILLLHGLMGSSRTWRRQVPWIREFGHVYTFDAAGHGRPAPAALTTEAFVEDLTSAGASIEEPMIVIGHSMGALHAWCFAAAHPEKVCALVLEDMAPDFRGRTAADWAQMISAWPQPFASEEAMKEFFGPVAGQYFLDSFDRRDDGWYLHGDVSTFRDISEEWGTRHFWDQWKAIEVPTLLIEGEFTITPEGQMREMAERPGTRYVRIADAGHLVHDDQPQRYREVVTEFLQTVS